jgi:transposase
MRAGIVVSVTPQDRIRLEAILTDGNTRQKHAARARVIVATADGCGTNEIMRRSGLSKPVVWRWQERFMQEGVDGLLRDRTRKPGKPPLPAETVQRVIDLTLADPPGETTHWSVRAMAKAAGIGAISVQRIWQANGLTPHRMKSFKLSNDPKFAESSAMSSASTSIRPPMPPCCRSTKRAKSRRSTAPSPGCRSRRVGPGP